MKKYLDIKNPFLSISILLILGLTYIAISAFNNTSREKTKEKSTPTKNFEEDYNVFSLKLPENPTFAGEPIPIQDADVYERFDRELLVNTYWQSNGILLIKRAKKYFPIIEPILKEEGVPDDFKYLALAESALLNVTSPAGAKGFWQIMPATARDYGLEVNGNVDERFHIEKATRFACEYLKSAKEKFGSWALAAASYNAGRSYIINELDRQEANGYYDLLLGEETSRYVFRIAAMKTIFENPKQFGFHIDEDHYYKPLAFKTVEVDSAVSNLAALAKNYGMSYKVLKIFNPWLRENKLRNRSGKLYQIKILTENHYKVLAP
jgi:hypothetical protein